MLGYTVGRGVGTGHGHHRATGTGLYCHERPHAAGALLLTNPSRFAAVSPFIFLGDMSQVFRWGN